MTIREKRTETTVNQTKPSTSRVLWKAFDRVTWIDFGILKRHLILGRMMLVNSSWLLSCIKTMIGCRAAASTSCDWISCCSDGNTCWNQSFCKWQTRMKNMNVVSLPCAHTPTNLLWEWGIPYLLGYDKSELFESRPSFGPHLGIAEYEPQNHWNISSVDNIKQNDRKNGEKKECQSWSRAHS